MRISVDSEYASSPCSLKPKMTACPISLSVQTARKDEGTVFHDLKVSVLATSVETVLRHRLIIVCPIGKVGVSICLQVAVGCHCSIPAKHGTRQRLHARLDISCRWEVWWVTTNIVCILRLIYPDVIDRHGRGHHQVVEVDEPEVRREA